MSDQLAILGGEPVRKKPYPVHSTMLDDAEEREVIEVLRGGHLSGFSGTATDRFLGGEKVKKFEKKFARRFGVAHAVSVNSATSALHCAVAATGVEPGEEIITSPYTMSATASAILMENAIPVFADIDDEIFCLAPSSVEACITERTRAILTVNLFGHPSPLYELKDIAERRGIMLLEDNAQSPLAEYKGSLAGTIGRIGIQSLNYHKTIQAGEGGVALTNDPDLALRMQLKRNHGEVVVGPMGREDIPNALGWNYRLPELCAAVGIAQLDKLEFLTEVRQRLAVLLTQQLAEFEFLTPPKVFSDCSHVYYQYAMKFDARRVGIARAVFVKALKAEGISVAEGYLRPIYHEPIYQKRTAYGTKGVPFGENIYKGNVSYEFGICPTAERMWEEELLTTDICKYPNTEREVEEFVRAIGKIEKNIGKLKGMG